MLETGLDRLFEIRELVPTPTPILVCDTPAGLRLLLDKHPNPALIILGTVDGLRAIRGDCRSTIIVCDERARDVTPHGVIVAGRDDQLLRVMIDTVLQ